MRVERIARTAKTAGSRGRGSERAFSLVEVAFSLAIIATVGVTLIGLIPSGFENVRRAGDLSVISRIVQTTASDALSSDWDDYAARFTGEGRMMNYYDDQGNLLKESGGENHIYSASVELAELSASDRGRPAIALPGDRKLQIDRSGDLRRILIRVTNIPGEQGVEVLRQGDSSPAISEHFVIISNFKPIEPNEAP